MPYVSPGPTVDSQNQLIQILQNAYSGELAANYAYEGHRDSVSDPQEKAEIEKIRLDELEHRERVGAMLKFLGGGPCPAKERKLSRIGKTISFLCHMGGWFIPMYGAGKLESQNIHEYQVAALHAHALGLLEFAEDLLKMAEVEWDHEKYFREKMLQSRLARVFPHWPVPPPRATIRELHRSATVTEGAPHF